MTTLTVDDLSSDQRNAYRAIVSWLSDPSASQVLTLGGYAGTGKSTVVSVLAHDLPRPLAFCAFTGKAASVLRRKLSAAGIATLPRALRRDEFSMTAAPYCGTIHGLIKRPCPECMIEADLPAHDGLGQCVQGIGEDPPPCPVHPKDKRGVCSSCAPCAGCHPPPPKPRPGTCPTCHNGRFLQREELDRDYQLIVCDEASMVSDDMLGDLQSFGAPILAVGDHGQLPPVGGQGSLMRAPQLRLEQIHRQAAGNPIIALSVQVRETGELDEACADGVRVRFLRRKLLPGLLAEKFGPWRSADWRATCGDKLLAGAVIVPTNKMRIEMNDDVREVMGLSGELPQKGEVLVCLLNRKTPPISNGMRGVVLEQVIQTTEHHLVGSVGFTEDGIQADRLVMCAHQFFREKTLGRDDMDELGLSFTRAGALMDFGYVMTCHKMQGSQVEDLVVVGRQMWGSEDERRRWLYVAVTRASERLTVLV